MEFDTFRVVHACWDDSHIHFLQHQYRGIKAEFLRKGNDKNDHTGIYTAIEETLKGKESPLPDGYSFSDKDDNERQECRVRWWRDPAYREKLKHILISCPEEIADRKLSADDNYYAYTKNKPVFFGHYWLKGTHRIENPNAVCLDYSVAKGGVLVACRLGDEIKLIY